MNSQRGVALIVSLVFLAVLAAMSVALLSSSAVDVKTATTDSSRKVTDEEVEGAIDDVIIRAQNQVTGENFFTLDEARFPDAGMEIEVTDTDADARVFFLIAATCPRGTGWDTGISCNYLRVDAEKTFGKHQHGNIKVGQGVAQQYFDGGQ